MSSAVSQAPAMAKSTAPGETTAHVARRRDHQGRARRTCRDRRPASKAVLSGVDVLTPSELRVARMAVDGMTNREIAQQLYVTAKTVETHLRHVYQKLDIAGRADLPTALTGP